MRVLCKLVFRKGNIFEIFFWQEVSLLKHLNFIFLTACDVALGSFSRMRVAEGLTISSLKISSVSKLWPFSVNSLFPVSTRFSANSKRLLKDSDSPAKN